MFSETVAPIRHPLSKVATRICGQRWQHQSVFKSKKNPDRDLLVPSEVEADPKAMEVLRAWVANEGLVCAVRPELWKDATSWGIVLADVTRHVANARKALYGDDAAITVDKIKAVFNSELTNPTDEPTGHF